MRVRKNIISEQIAILTIVLPFVSFKFLLGMVSLKILPFPFSVLIGISLLLIGFFDISINMLNLFMLFFLKKAFYRCMLVDHNFR